MSADDAKRRNLRFECNISAELVTTLDAPMLRGKILDIGKQGCLFALSSAADVAPLAKVILVFKLNKTQVRVRGIVRSQRENNSLGIQFDRVSSEIGRQLGAIAPAKSFGYEFRDSDGTDFNQDVNWIESEREPGADKAESSEPL